MKVVAILQARMNSTRLPGKVLLPLGGKPMVQNIIERVQRAKRVDTVCLAVPFSDASAFMPFTGGNVTFVAPMGTDESDLVGRYLHAADTLGADLIVRVPCDNPCVDPEYIDRAISGYFLHPWTFYSNTTAVVESQDGDFAFDGLGCEVLSMSRLKWLDTVTTCNSEWREHLHKYFYDLNEVGDNEAYGFGINITPPDIADDEPIRLDVNTLDDYHFIEKIYNHFGHNHFTAQEILNCPPVQERLHGRG